MAKFKISKFIKFENNPKKIKEIEHFISCKIRVDYETNEYTGLPDKEDPTFVFTTSHVQRASEGDYIFKIDTGDDEYQYFVLRKPN